MEWLPVAGILTALFGGSGIGGFYLANYKTKKEVRTAERLAEANIAKLEAETTLKVKESEMRFIDKLKEDRDHADQRIDQLTQLLFEERRLNQTRLDELTGRIRKLENTLLQHNIPIPE